MYRKHYPPALGDDVWRLEKIGKAGAFHQKLAQSGVRTVQEFLQMLTVKPDLLRGVSHCFFTIRLANHGRFCCSGSDCSAFLRR